MSLLNLKLWERVEYKPDDAPAIFSVELKRPTRQEARPIQRALVGVLRDLPRVDDLPSNPTPEQLATRAVQDHAFSVAYSTAVASLHERISDEDLTSIFTACVRNVHGLTLDGQAVETGEQFLDLVAAAPVLVMWVLRTLSERGQLSPGQSKTSASRSTSSAEAGIGAGQSDAPSTEREAGARS
jgi:hypothetical protein